jgi:cation diffusion facilitator family transporter
MPSISKGLGASRVAIAVNTALALVKIVAGVLGRSYALVADGIESTLDIASSFIVWVGLRVSSRPADRSHPYGHGKAEAIAAMLVSLLLILAACLIATQSIREIMSPQRTPAPYTLIILLGVMTVKEILFRWVNSVSRELHSTALRSDAWHHRSDVLTSLAAFIGISVALAGGSRFAAADGWAALLACGIILWNGIRLLRLPLDEMMDAAVPRAVEDEVRVLAEGADGVLYVEKCRIRKSGTQYLVDVHVTVRGAISVADGHRIGHDVKDSLLESDLPIADVLVHVEPDSLTTTPG